MRLVRFTPIAIASALLAACGGGGGGGGGGPEPFTLSGLAATGAPVANRTVTIKCAIGETVTTTTDGSGAFTRALPAHRLPCLLEADSAAGRLHGVATAAGRVNITPLTSLIVARTARANPTTMFAATNTEQIQFIAANTATATTAIVAESSRLMGWVPAGNPLTQAFAIGDDEDKALDNLGASLTNASATLATVITAAAAGTPLIAALPAEESRGHDAKAFVVPTAIASATTFAAMPAATGDTVDMSTTQRWAGTLTSYDNSTTSPRAAYRIEVPANWNGELVMYTHGYAGEGLTLGANDSTIRRHLIQNGYAWAASGYSRNSYDVRAGIEDTNKLANAFASITGKAAPSRTYIVGHSMGGHIAAAAVEEEVIASAQHKVRYAGSVPLCPVAGDGELFNTFAAVGLAALQLSGVNAALPTTLSARDRYRMLLDVAVNPSSVRNAVHAALFNGYPTAGFTPNGTAGARYASVLKNLTGGTRPLFDIGLAYGGSYPGGMASSFGNDATLTGVGTKYNVDSTRFTYVVDGDAPTSATLNAGLRVTPDANFNPLRRDGLRWVPQVNGRPYAPVVTLHTLGDIFVPFSMQQVYRQRLIAAGAARADRVVHRAIRGASHCDFTNAEVQTAFDDMVRWVKQGTKPAGDDVMTAATVAAATYGCTHTKNALHPVDEATGTTRTLRGLIQQLGQSCPAS